MFLILCLQENSDTVLKMQPPGFTRRKHQGSGQKKPLLENSGAHENY